jgi:hypothetical protein
MTKKNIQIGRLQIKTYRVPARFANVIVEHDDLQGDVYWVLTLIFGWRAIQFWLWGNTSGKYTVPRFEYRLFKPRLSKGNLTMTKKIVYNAIAEAIRYLSDPNQNKVEVHPLTLSMVLADAVPDTPDHAPGSFDRNSYLTELVLRKVNDALRSSEFANDVVDVFDAVESDEHAILILKRLKRRFR